MLLLERVYTRASCQTEDDRAGCDAAGHAALKRTLKKRGNAEREHVSGGRSPPGGRRKSRTAIRCQPESQLETTLWRVACIPARLKSSRVQRARAKRRRESPNNVVGRVDFFVSEIAVVGPVSSSRECSSRRRGSPRFRARSRSASTSSDADGKSAIRGSMSDREFRIYLYPRQREARLLQCEGASRSPAIDRRYR